MWCLFQFGIMGRTPTFLLEFSATFYLLLFRWALLFLLWDQIHGRTFSSTSCSYFSSRHLSATVLLNALETHSFFCKIGSILWDLRSKNHLPSKLAQLLDGDECEEAMLQGYTPRTILNPKLVCRRSSKI